MASWYVLVERVKYGEWSLVDKISVEGGEEEALARAEETARTRTPWYSTDSSQCGRLVFRTSPTSWLVELTESSWSKGEKSPTTYTEHLNIRVAELVHVQELVPAEPPRKGRFGR
ncbi:MULTISPECIES: hypothetical protein [Streptomyces]|uniref:hypothetical protein n=1 Tax=Streptomyces TaxID=1883 RepID=UPI001677278A|nr:MULTISPECIES: hypothetical protein [Streptomyces]MBK3523177.1 hypothetical protein [Streptomyces sp. MBT70]GGS15023.1 hypothetical protein GCM10010236_81320 [Streptomyces eurythermus]